MNSPFFRALCGVLAAAFALASGNARACSSCGCTLSSDWDSQGFATTSGLRFDIRYDYLDQSQLRSGRRAVDRSSLPLPQDREIELDTVNRYTTLGVDYSPGADWGITLQLPYVDRFHRTFAEDETEVSWSRSGSIGDARVTVRYQGFTAERNLGIQFGLKLATGRHDVVFAGGSEAGELVDRGLQPGSGSTDAVLGAYKFGTLNQDWDYFAKGRMQAAVAGGDYRTGASLNVDTGLRYMGSDRFVPQIQINARVARRDSGAAADRENSGGTLIDISPGVSVKLSRQLSVFGFLQLPLYQRVNGLQLAPRMTASVGARIGF